MKQKKTTTSSIHCECQSLQNIQTYNCPFGYFEEKKHLKASCQHEPVSPTFWHLQNVGIEVITEGFVTEREKQTF